MKGDAYEVEIEEVEEAKNGAGGISDEIEDKLLKSVQQKDKKKLDEGNLLAEAFNQGITAFNPDIMFENITSNYAMAKKIYGETLIRLISGYSPSFVEKNITIPEFKKELRKKIDHTIEEMKEEGLLKRNGTVSEAGTELASLVMMQEELDHIVPKGGMGEHVSKHVSHYGERTQSRQYRRGDRYRDIAIKESLKLALRRGKKEMTLAELRTSLRQSKGQTELIYALDASGSMKGKKLEMCKKAGIALAFRAIEQNDKVGLLVFGSEVKKEISPTSDFPLLLREITKIMASRQTDFREMLRKSLELFTPGQATKHLIILTDAMPTVGENPREESLKEVSKIRNAGITVSLVGINLDSEARKFAERLVEIGQGRLYLVREIEELDTIILEDYAAFSR